jgi:hypothetical protein
MVRVKYAAVGRASGRWSVLPDWIVPVLAGAVLLSLFDQFYALYRVFWPDLTQSSGSPNGLPLPVRIYQWAVWGVNQAASLTTLLPAALLAWFASSRQSWVPRVGAGARFVALGASLAIAALSAMRSVAALLWLAFGDSTQMTYGLATDNVVNFLVGSGVMANTSTSLVAAVLAWALQAARPADIASADVAPVDIVPVDIAPADTAEFGVQPPLAADTVSRHRSEVLDMAAYRRPPRQSGPRELCNGDTGDLSRRPS